MTTLHERMVHMVRQLDIPVLEASLVVSKYTRILLEALQNQAENNGERIPEELTEPLPIELAEPDEQAMKDFDLDRLLEVVDEQRMDILDTLIRNTINEEEITHADSLFVMRTWERDLRQMLSQVKSPGQLFSPMQIPEDH
tara:strand:+ start:82 stop:504 length:423 start_codon:yes stop_codon:yes gene_type:complete